LYAYLFFELAGGNLPLAFYIDFPYTIERYILPSVNKVDST